MGTLFASTVGGYGGHSCAFAPSYTAAARLSFAFSKILIAGLAYFRNDVDNMMVTDRTGQVYEGADLYIYENIDKAMTQGIEVTAQYYLNDNCSVLFGYTYTDKGDDRYQRTGRTITLCLDMLF
ncbi:TonB-dependent receptor domain-containing protein [Desulfobacter sp.]|uniref:TonB-dependent receptor domain-containing protein n=1 Tax=Desulfobacter sp. TaxID=2294 RepID=UPI003D0C1F08